MTTHKKQNKNLIGTVLAVTAVVVLLLVSMNSMNQPTKQNGSLPGDTNTPPAVVSTDAQTAGATPADI